MDRPSPCANSCEAQAFYIEIRSLKSKLKTATTLLKDQDDTLTQLSRSAKIISTSLETGEFIPEFRYDNFAAHLKTVIELAGDKE